MFLQALIRDREGSNGQGLWEQKKRGEYEKLGNSFLPFHEDV